MKEVKMKWFDFNVILECYACKKLLKSHMENKLKNKENIFFRISLYSLLLFTVNFHSQLPLLFVFSGKMQQKEFLTAFCPHILTFLYYTNTRDEFYMVYSWLHYIIQYCYFSLPKLQEYKLDVYLSCPNCKLLGSLCVCDIVI